MFGNSATSTAAATSRKAAKPHAVPIETAPEAIGRRHFLGWSRSASASKMSLTT